MRRQVHHAAERRRAGVAEIIEQDDQHIGRARRRLDLEDGRRLGIAGIELGDRPDASVRRSAARCDRRRRQHQTLWLVPAHRQALALAGRMRSLASPPIKGRKDKPPHASSSTPYSLIWSCK